MAMANDSRRLATLEAKLRLGVAGGGALTVQDARDLVEIMEVAARLAERVDVCMEMCTAGGVPSENANGVLTLRERVALLISRCRALDAVQRAQRPDTGPGAARQAILVIRVDLPLGCA